MKGSVPMARRRGRSAAWLAGMAILAAVSPASADPPDDPPAVTPPPEEASAAAGSPPGETGRRLMGRIRGTVFDRERTAHPGLLVTLSSRSEPDILRVTGTNEKGQYLFQELPPGVYDLKVQGEGFQDAGKQNIEVRPPFQNIVDVRLPGRAEGTPSPGSGGPSAPDGAAATEQVAAAASPVIVRGRFVDREKHPLVEVSVLLASAQGNRIHQAFSGDDGVFEIPDVVPGRYRVIVRSPGHVALDLRSVEILGKLGLTVSLMLVDYPLDFRSGQALAAPLEEPRPAPAPPATETDAPASTAHEGGPAPSQEAPAGRPGG